MTMLNLNTTDLNSLTLDFQLFLLHIDEIISSMCGKEPYGGLLGSTSICCDQETKVYTSKHLTLFA